MPDPSSSEFELTYFDTHGRGLQVRLLLHVSDTSFVDRRVSRAQWPALKRRMPWGSIPVLQHGDAQIFNSCAIMRYVAKQVDMWPDNELDQVRSLALMGCVEDVWASLAKFARIKNPLNWLWQARKMIASDLPSNCDLFQAQLAGDFFLGDEMSAVDLAVFSLFAVVLDRAGKRGARKVIEARPTLWSFMQRMYGDPRVAAYLQTHPDQT